MGGHAIGLWLLAMCLALGWSGQARADRINVCHGYSCYYQTRLELSTGDMKRIGSIMRGGSSSADAERRAIAKAVQYLERRATAVVGIRDRPQTDIGRGRERGQMDCVDESTNTTAVLRVIEGRGWLKHHKVVRTASRGFFADGRYPHFTAVLHDRSGQKWAVDSWYEPGGGKPDIMPLERWRARGGSVGR